MRLVAVIIFNAFINATAQIVLKIGMNRIGGFSLDAPITFFLKVLGNFYAWLGISLYVISLAVWLVVLSKANVSFAYPLMGLSYVFGMLLAMLVLGERVTAWEWLGTSCIVLGIYFITKSA